MIIPVSLQRQVLELLHLGHFGIVRMKQLARTAVYWCNIDADIESTCKECTACAEQQNLPPKNPVHPWMMPEKPWSRVHIDHAIDFMGSHWLVVVDAYTKYPCIYPTSSTSTKATTDLLEECCAHFGYPHSLVSDNATTFTSADFQSWCKGRGITHLTGAPYHPATNGVAERLVQSFKQSLRKSALPPKPALLEFLQLYRRTPLSTGYSPSELLNGRRIRTKIDALLPSAPHMAQRQQMRESARREKESQPEGISGVSEVHKFSVGTPCYAVYHGPRRDRQPRWVPATVVKIGGPRTVIVKVHPSGHIRRRHIDQLQIRAVSHEDKEPPYEGQAVTESREPVPTARDHSDAKQVPPARDNSDDKALPPMGEASTPVGEASTAKTPQYGSHNPRRSKRAKKKTNFYGY